jgi:hypothetical protein
MRHWILRLKGLAVLGTLLLLHQVGRATENQGQKASGKGHLRNAASCAPASASAQLDVNNVRCLLHNGGDMWWDLTDNPRYEIPKVSDPAMARHSAFAASLWIGGLDIDGNLRVAAQTYRQRGNDFFPGPLTQTGAVTGEVCDEWNKMFKINKAEIDAFRAAWLASSQGGPDLNMADFPAVRDWPAFGENADGRLALAPFVDMDGNTLDYDPQQGDYPDIRPVEGGGQPDQAIWWVINDKGDIHTETGGQPIGLEIQMMAFAFATANAVNDMTFYKYKVINKSGSPLYETFMGQWADVDLGYAYDDYVGCDTVRGFGYAYNGDAHDEGANGYGDHPPVFGIDFFQGPMNESGQRLDMSRFVYYDNSDGLTGNPEVATHYYGYLRGFWKDGSRMTEGGNGFHGTTPIDYMFPGDPGACGAATGWSELGSGTPAYDRRFLMSAGPFTLQNGASNEIITGAVWARSDQNAQLGSLCEALQADDLAQALFDANFQLLDGPDAPELAIEEFDQALTLSWGYTNGLIFNNFNEGYAQVDPVLASQNVADPEFEFQGYIVYQLRDGSVSANELFDTERARIVSQCDIRDGVSTIVNRSYTLVGGLPDPIVVDQVMVQGADQGIFHSVEVVEDLFADGDDRRLKNYTPYYYGVLAYAWNGEPSDGRQFVQGNRYFRNVSAMPHRIRFEAGGTVVSAGYGDGVPVVQTAAIGNGARDVELDAATVSTILQRGRADRLGYEAGYSPINLQVVNAKEVQRGDYRLEVVGDEPVGPVVELQGTGHGRVLEQEMAEWVLYHNGQPVYRSTYIQRRDSAGAVLANRPMPLSGVQRVVPGHGISIGVRDAQRAGLIQPNYNPILAARVDYADPLHQWLGGYADVDRDRLADWIMAGIDTFDRGVFFPVLQSASIYDPDANFETMVGGTFAPFCLARSFVVDDLTGQIAPGVTTGPGAPVFTIRGDSMVGLDELPDVDIVITSDQSKWSRCVVVETCPAKAAGSGAHLLAAKNRIGLGTNLQPMGGALTTANQGWSMFPGYAIDVNTGRRLNVFFGENTWDRVNNGDDLLFNPTDGYGSDGSAAGGRHYLYVSKTAYDGCAAIHDILAQGTLQGIGTQLCLSPLLTPDVWDNPTHLGRVYKDVAWVGVPMAMPGLTWKTYDQIPSDVRLSLRVNHPFHSRPATTDHPIFEFNTDALAAQFAMTDQAMHSLMEDVRVVPNPYYAYSKYERSQLQTIVKITNLPQRCKISIFNLSGTLVRSYDKDSDSPEQSWDLKNQSGVGVAGGVYIIHVDGFKLGETVVKAMVIMPQLDLNAF